MRTLQSKIIVILGPNASGKSTLAVELARKFSALGGPTPGWNGAEIISADSRQVYKGLDIGTGKITKKEMHDVPHYLLDVASPRRTFTVAQYQKLARRALAKILAKGKIPILCGGTGLYADAVLHNISFPSVPPNPKLRRELEKKSAAELFARLEKFDPRRAAHIDWYNKRRLIRALEITLTTGKPVPQHSYILQNVRMFDVLKIGIRLPPQDLKERIRIRLFKRLRQGLMKEVKRLHKNGVSWQRLDDLGLEYRWVSRYLRGLITKKEMEEILEKEIWRYAKRQMTWFKRDKEIHWVKNKKEAITLASRFLFEFF